MLPISADVHDSTMTNERGKRATLSANMAWVAISVDYKRGRSEQRERRSMCSARRDGHREIRSPRSRPKGCCASGRGERAADGDALRIATGGAGTTHGVGDRCADALGQGPVARHSAAIRRAPLTCTPHGPING